MSNDASEDLKSGALHYHRHPQPGKIEVTPTKPLGNQRDLALAYSPGVATPCEAIVEDPEEVDNLTSRSNLVAVLTNGTAVLGLGNIGPLASKPVMEGKAVLFKKFAGIDVFDLEVKADDPEKFCEVATALEPTFGGINLEDIKAPECFEIEEALIQRMNIPVLHDDQHGTAIIVAAAIQNGLSIADKRIEDVKIVTAGAGAAALACLNMLLLLGARRENIWVTDIDGVVHTGRAESMDRWKAKFARETAHRTLADVIPDADVFLGLSTGGVLKPEMLQHMAERPLVLALANPIPEIMPDVAKEARPDVMICTGRSDFPNQVNNVLCFPYLFRGALDVGATQINDEMKLAAVKAIAALAREPSSDVAARAYGGQTRLFGPDFLIPTPFDPRLILRIAPAVARAAMDSGVARRPIEDFDAYNDRLNRFVFRSGLVMKPLFTQARTATKRVIYAEGEDERVLRAAQVSIEEGLAQPILVGRPDVVRTRLDRYGLSIEPGKDFELINPQDDPRYRDYVDTYLRRTWRRGVTPDRARTVVRTSSTVIAALAVERGEADAMICGLEGRFDAHLAHIRDVIGVAPGVRDFSALSLIIVSNGAYFLADTHVTTDPTADEIADMCILSAKQVCRFGMTPKIALLSHSAFGSRDTPSAQKMREAVELIRRKAPELEVEGEMHGDAALDEAYRKRVYPLSTLTGEANMLIMPNLDAANIVFHLLKTVSNALPVGPILLGAAKPAHILTPSVTARGVVNMTAIAAVEAQSCEES
ncbi:NADP-dependent malic enzyme [Dichotomicrobium thermohalophilum]|uniref:Malate dehydrogenase (Oxaloacetate-decarboxylating)(NADP+) n=1 Tax=Dichotomicrobium thermohalophilum TaxID=933063 RepID=A0A397Q2Q8_9HYPH|nr:NADP-dependent malic enzyme [Dichotomicrobium thermohalophilum]RIA55338.1 malate dehydrogenase (oxaloacetate-decarboxylating)(NADP+) [Dichotomicrobium thermohalophilum]